jgi:hypothetical protein
MLQLRRPVIILRESVTISTWGSAGIFRLGDPTMRFFETVISTVLTFTALALVVEVVAL